MFSTLIVVFREALEIALILGVVLAATRGLPGRIRFVVSGFALGCFGAFLVALFADHIANFAEGIGKELFDAAILFCAAALIAWTMLWMKAHARTMMAHIKKVGTSVKEGELPYYSLVAIVAMAMLREGSEIVLFTHGLMAAGYSLSSITMGALAGAIAGTLVGVLLYFGIIAISSRHIFAVTSWMLLFLSAGLAAMAARTLSSAGYFSEWSAPVWNSSWLISDDGWFGAILHGLMGYNAQPLQIQLFTYVVVFLGLLCAMRWVDRTKLG